MTTEEMNIKIAEYMGWTENPEYETFNQPFPFFDEVWRFDELPFDTSWSHLMPVWQKLRCELDDLSVYEYGTVKHSDYIISKHAIEKSILSCDITTAHRLIVEAIELIKK